MKLSALFRANFFILALLALTYPAITLADNHNKNEKKSTASKQSSDHGAWSEAGNSESLTIFRASLTPAEEKTLSNTPVDKQTPANARGYFLGVYNQKTNRLNFMIGYKDLSGSGMSMSHFHLRCAGEGKEPPICKPGSPSAPVIQTICGMPTKPGATPDWPATKDNQGRKGLETKCSMGTSGAITAQWLVEEQYRADLMNGKVYVNLHTKLNPKGEVTGLLEKSQ
ncbi:CHRD domain-containing protein [Microbulbifer echini]|uniref:CHRD domain-containing protein n=1 Tax=Microbulbifer echini TaxID=1529067 RepID=A0ABV4NIT5_9GAMM|nr:CHRD domain-containing protein [uncultured Microbulbifer sp.]